MTECQPWHCWVIPAEHGLILVKSTTALAENREKAIEWLKAALITDSQSLSRRQRLPARQGGCLVARWPYLTHPYPSRCRYGCGSQLGKRHSSVSAMALLNAPGRAWAHPHREHDDPGGRERGAPSDSAAYTYKRCSIDSEHERYHVSRLTPPAGWIPSVGPPVALSLLVSARLAVWTRPFSAP
jgi:hypothetical protein